MAANALTRVFGYNPAILQAAPSKVDPLATKSSTNMMFFGATSMRSTLMLSQCRIGVAPSSGLPKAGLRYRCHLREARGHA